MDMSNKSFKVYKTAEEIDDIFYPLKYDLKFALSPRFGSEKMMEKMAVFEHYTVEINGYFAIYIKLFDKNENILYEGVANADYGKGGTLILSPPRDSVENLTIN